MFPFGKFWRQPHRDYSGLIVLYSLVIDTGLCRESLKTLIIEEFSHPLKKSVNGHIYFPKFTIEYQQEMEHLFNNIESMKKDGFEGFHTIEELWMSKKRIPKSKGVYFVLYLSKNHPVFKETGSGGFFKGKNPNVPIDVLDKKWVTQTFVIYIGRGGQIGKKSTLKSRLSQYLRFGKGKDVGHWGGRYIFQLDNPKELVICWKETEQPEQTENELINNFISHYCKLPFGNLISM